MSDPTVTPTPAEDGRERDLADHMYRRACERLAEALDVPVGDNDQPMPGGWVEAARDAIDWLAAHPSPAVSAPDLDAIRARADAATPGPWHAMTNLAGVPNGVNMQPSPATFAVVHTDEEPHRLAADTAFIAHAREDVPVLLAALAAAHAERDEACAALAALQEAVEGFADRIESAGRVLGYAVATDLRAALAGAPSETEKGR